MAEKKDNISNNVFLRKIQFSREELPKFYEKADVRNSYIEWGEKNAYPCFLKELSRKSALHSAILKAKTDMIAGAGFVKNTDLKQSDFILKNDMEDVLNKISFDIDIYGAGALNLIWSNDGEEIAKVKYVDVARLREFYTEDLDVYNRNNKTNLLPGVTYYWYCDDWAKLASSKNKKRLFQEFSSENKTEKSQILIIKEYNPGLDYYSLPDYVGGILSIQTDYETSNFWLSNLQNGFAPSVHINSANGQPKTDEEADEIYDRLSAKYKGTSNTGEVILSFSNGDKNVMTITPIATNDSDDKYINLHDNIIQNILSAHRVTNPELFGVAVPGQLGQAKDALINSYELFYTTVIKPKIKLIENSLNKIAKINQFSDFKIEKFEIYEDNTAPIKEGIGFIDMTTKRKDKK